jgi:hypothetical protein
VLGGLRTEKEQRLVPRIAAAFRSRTTGGQQVPQGTFTLVGSVEQIRENVLANREQFDVPYIGIFKNMIWTSVLPSWHGSPGSKP